MNAESNCVETQEPSRCTQDAQKMPPRQTQDPPRANRETKARRGKAKQILFSLGVRRAAVMECSPAAKTCAHHSTNSHKIKKWTRFEIPRHCKHTHRLLTSSSCFETNSKLKGVKLTTRGTAMCVGIGNGMIGAKML